MNKKENHLKEKANKSLEEEVIITKEMKVKGFQSLECGDLKIWRFH